MGVETTEMKAELDGLKENIIRLQERITTVPTPSPPLLDSPPSLSQNRPVTRSRFSRFRAPFRRISSTSTKKSSRDDPGSSTEALLEPVGRPLPPPEQTRDKTAGDLLSLLAPLVSRLQVLGKSVKHSVSGAGEVDQELVEDFKRCCIELEGCIATFTARSSSADEGLDAHDTEMKVLLLDALTKKVVAERTALPVNSPALSRASSAARSASPFVLHSSDVLGLGARRASTSESGPRTIPIGIASGPASTGHLGPYPSFADAGQHTGLSNVFRLGSFQNSLLFSPSPVAVRQPFVTGGMRM